MSLVDTQPEIVPTPAEQPAAPSVRVTRPPLWSLIVAGLAAVAVLVVLAAGVLPSTMLATKRDCVTRDEQGACIKKGPEERVQFAIVPAAAQPVVPLIEINGPATYASKDQLLFVTVRQPELSLLDYFVGKDNGAVDPKSYSDIYSNDTPQQQTNRNRRAMRTAKDTAEYVALSRLGFDAKLLPGDVVIDQMVCLDGDYGNPNCPRAPSDKLLDPGDQLLEVDGRTLKTVDDLGPILAKHKPGDKVSVRFERGDEELIGNVELIAAPKGDPPRTIIGFVPSDTATISLPSDVKVDLATGDIGGPSAGLAFTLTLIDQLTPGDLAGGKKVAVTGEINVNGEVGAIGGLPSKASAVKQAGAKYFLVPTNQGDKNIAEAKAVVGDAVTIIPVGTLDEALTALAELGGEVPKELRPAQP